MEELINKIFSGTYSQLFDKSCDVRTITCINQHYFNLVYKDEKYLKHIMNFDLIFPDGIGMMYAIKMLKNISTPIEYITGSDYYTNILKKLSYKRIFLLGDNNKILKKSRMIIQNEFPSVKVVGVQSGYENVFDEKIIKKINEAKPEILFVGLGSKRQEKWINNYKNKLIARKIIVVGGWFRILAGDRKRGPKFIQQIGGEWMIRLLTEPRYVWKRYILGIPLFIYRIIILKYKKQKG